MELQAAVRLIEKGIETSPRQHWADLGAGAGLFTEVLLNLLPDDALIHSVDRDITQLKNSSRLPTSKVKIHQLDLVHESLPFEQLDGVLIANTLHFIRDQIAFLKSLKTKVRPGGRIIIVEYDTDQPNQWVPFPVSVKRLGKLLSSAGFAEPTKLEEAPSVYHRSMYAALILL